MKKIVGFCFFLLSLSCSAQIIKEPLWGNMTREEYMSMLLDSLIIAEKDNDTVKVIRYTAVLGDELYFTPDRHLAYLYKALVYAKTYHDPVFLADVYNRLGSLYWRNINKLDSSVYWYRQTVETAQALGQPIMVGWGYKGLLTLAANYPIIKSVKDSASFFLDKAVEMGTLTHDDKLVNISHFQYGEYLRTIGDWQGVASILKKQLPRVNQMTIPQKLHFYDLSHDYIAAINHLDTLNRIRELIYQLRLFESQELHRQELYAKDQQYEVSKTKTTLEATASQLKITNRVLVISIVGLVAFALLIMYLFFLFRKNKNLSQRNELLLKEQNHRVKNNLQMISSLLSLQSEKLLSVDAKDALGQSQGRINSVALLHRMLYEGENVGEIEVTSYIRSLVEEIKYSAGREVETELNLPEKLELKIEKITSLGLIINELSTNSIKHVDKNITLCVHLHLSMNDNKLHLIYTDNGRGVAPEVWMSSESFGNQLIRMQSRQLKGDFEVGAANGFKYELKISV